MASGFIVTDVYESPHWDKEQARLGKVAKRVPIEFDRIYSQLLITEEDLSSQGLAGFQWFSQSSGIRIPSKYSDVLEKIWRNRDTNDTGTDERGPKTYIEGQRKFYEGYRYERNSQARSECLKYYGDNCYICEQNPKDLYGDISNGVIHIHHKSPISLVGNKYSLNPITDLIPLCPNCHANVNRIIPAYDVDYVKKKMQEQKLLYQYPRFISSN